MSLAVLRRSPFRSVRIRAPSSWAEISVGNTCVVSSMLTIGDGLVTVIPALMISISGGLIITRASSDTKLGLDFQKQVFSNSQMTTQQIRAYCELSTDAERLLERAMQQQGLTARAHDRILKVARTIADLDAAENIEPRHLSEAIQYRTLDRSYWA